MNGDVVGGSAVCTGGLVLGGGYSLTASRPEDNEKLIAFQNFPADPRTWTVFMQANANVQPFLLRVFAVCAS